MSSVGSNLAQVLTSKSWGYAQKAGFLLASPKVETRQRNYGIPADMEVPLSRHYGANLNQPLHPLWLSTHILLLDVTKWGEPKKHKRGWMQTFDGNDRGSSLGFNKNPFEQKHFTRNGQSQLNPNHPTRPLYE